MKFELLVFGAGLLSSVAGDGVGKCGVTQSLDELHNWPTELFSLGSAVPGYEECCSGTPTNQLDWRVNDVTSNGKKRHVGVVCCDKCCGDTIGYLDLQWAAGTGGAKHSQYKWAAC